MAKPKIRFKGYTDDWEQRKFSELYAKSSEKNDGSIGMDRNITVATMQFKEDVKVSTAEYLKTYYTFNFGDIAFEGHQSKEFRYGRFVENDIGNGIVSHIFAVFRPIKEFDLQFWKYAINNEMLMQRILSRSTKASTMMHDLVTEDFLNETFLVPSLDEQKKIGAYLKNLDHLITLHQRKCEETKKLKKYMLQKMFPQNGQKVPEIRFSGFTDDWEQRKLGDDIVNIHTGTNLIGSESNSGLPLIKMGNIQRGYFDTSKLEYLAENEYPEKEDIANYGDFFFNTRNTLELVGKGATWMGTSGEYAFNSNIARFEFKNIDTIFFNYLYNTEDMTRQIHARAMGTTSVAAIYPRTLESVEYYVPIMEEQQMIGSYFQSIDHLITLHQHKCEQLQSMKKFMLQNMFV